MKSGHDRFQNNTTTPNIEVLIFFLFNVRAIYSLKKKQPKHRQKLLCTCVVVHDKNLKRKKNKRTENRSLIETSKWSPSITKRQQ